MSINVCDMIVSGCCPVRVVPREALIQNWLRLLPGASCATVQERIGEASSREIPTKVRTYVFTCNKEARHVFGLAVGEESISQQN